MAHIHNSQHNQKKNVRVQTNTVVFYGHPELSGEEKSKFEFEEKKFSLLLKREVCRRFCLENATFSNKLNFFSSNSNFDFFFARQVRMTMIDCCISLKMIRKILVVLDMRHTLFKDYLLSQLYCPGLFSLFHTHT